jgi:hypothetical protein
MVCVNLRHCSRVGPSHATNSCKSRTKAFAHHVTTVGIGALDDQRAKSADASIPANDVHGVNSLLQHIFGLVGTNNL